jgi:hypothetical protein
MEDLLKDKIKDGYFYSIETPMIENKRNIVAHTGKGGIEIYIDKCRDKGLTDEQIMETIFIPLKNNEKINIKDVIWRKIEK